MTRKADILLVFFVSLIAFRAEARTPVDAVDLLPARADRDAAASSLSHTYRAKVTLVDLDPRLVTLLRWAVPNPDAGPCAERRARLREELAEEKWLAAPSSPDELLTTLIRQAEQQVLFMDLGGALESLKSARSIVGCETRPIAREEARDLFLYQAVAMTLLDDPEALDWLEDVLAIDPDYGLTPELDTAKVHSAFDEAMARSRQAVFRTVSVRGLPGEVLLDGQPLGEGSRVRPGRHILQVTSPSGDKRGASIRVPRAEGGTATPLELSSLVDLGFPPAGAVRDELESSLAATKLDPFQATALTRYLSYTKRDVVVFALAVPGGDGFQLRLYGLDGRLSDPTPKVLSALSSDRITRDEPSKTTVVYQDPLEEGERGPARFGVALGAGALGFTGTPDAFAAQGVRLGYALEVHYRLQRLRLQARLEGFPHALRPYEEDGDCGDYAGGQATAEQVEAVVLCLPRRSAFSAGLGVGYPVLLSPGLELVPALLMEGSYLPDTIRENEAIPGGLALFDALLAGPMARVRLVFGRDQVNRRFSWGLEASTGALLAMVDGKLLLAVPVGVMASGGMLF